LQRERKERESWMLARGTFLCAGHSFHSRAGAASRGRMMKGKGGEKQGLPCTTGEVPQMAPGRPAARPCNHSCCSARTVPSSAPVARSEKHRMCSIGSDRRASIRAPPRAVKGSHGAEVFCPHLSCCKRAGFRLVYSGGATKHRRCHKWRLNPPELGGRETRGKK